MKLTPFFHRKTDKETERITTEYGAKPVQLGPDTVFMVPEHDNVRFSLKWKKILVLFISQDAHGGECLRSSFLLKSTILAESDFVISVKAFNATLLLVIALKPDLTIRMGGHQGLELGGRAILM